MGWAKKGRPSPAEPRDRAMATLGCHGAPSAGLRSPRSGVRGTARTSDLTQRSVVRQRGNGQRVLRQSQRADWPPGRAHGCCGHLPHEIEGAFGRSLHRLPTLRGAT
jgi:hypothetical protein